MNHTSNRMLSIRSKSNTFFELNDQSAETCETRLCSSGCPRTTRDSCFFQCWSREVQLSVKPPAQEGDILKLNWSSREFLQTCTFILQVHTIIHTMSSCKYMHMQIVAKHSWVEIHSKYSCVLWNDREQTENGSDTWTTLQLFWEFVY